MVSHVGHSRSEHNYIDAYMLYIYSTVLYIKKLHLNLMRKERIEKMFIKCS